MRAADARGATEGALRAAPPPPGRLWLLAAGKAAPAMTAGALAALRDVGRGVAGGLVVGVEASPPASGLEALAGDHPTPGDRSLAAAARVGDLLRRVEPDDVLLVLLSGGASALLAAPVEGVSAAELRALHDALLRSGADIGVVNRLRKRVARWGAGRVAAAVAPAAVHALLVSDVAGDDPATIGSGPCSADPTTAAELLALVARERLDAAIPVGVRAHLEAAAAGRAAETPKPGDAALANVVVRVVLRNADAVRGAAEAARTLGLAVEVVAEELAGDAAAAGIRCAERVLAGGAGPRAVLWGGETTVALPADAPPGGRCQALALAAAGALDRAAGAREAPGGVALLAAGTDGRDGPTDAAGAVVDAATWARVRRAGADPAALLAAHASHRALDLAGDLLRTGPTGTNVRDVVIGVVA